MAFRRSSTLVVCSGSREARSTKDEAHGTPTTTSMMRSSSVVLSGYRCWDKPPKRVCILFDIVYVCVCV
ncbi:hypothetical protein CYMTET_32071 [Cymbomonas tetramitiformis]|uniref:Uncharacterized protein n=1 Tax=Cymbomonas tetramitiformis TaxID=36881 RepID=A0AAE0FFJ2_9CHLO|nr:hypothetical protein CYMTET_32071 [Cymbomonas tetramitiformis]